MRKLVRAIIEKEGGDNAAVKAEIETNYKKGIVWYQGVRAGAWSADQGKMQLQGEAVATQEAFDELMK